MRRLIYLVQTTLAALILLSAMPDVLTSATRGVADNDLSGQTELTSPATLNHNAIACNTCHLLSSSATSQPQEERFTVACKGCHEARLSRTMPFHTSSDQLCIDCHSFHDPAMIQVQGNRFAVDFSDQERLFECTGCHRERSLPTDLSPGHLAAANLYHQNKLGRVATSPSDICMECHSSGSRLQELNLRGNPPAISHAASHPTGIRVFAGGGNGFRRMIRELPDQILTNQGTLQCQTCHDLAGGRTDCLAISDDSRYLCVSCHERSTL